MGAKLVTQMAIVAYSKRRNIENSLYFVFPYRMILSAFPLHLPKQHIAQVWDAIHVATIVASNNQGCEKHPVQISCPAVLLTCTVARTLT